MKFTKRLWLFAFVLCAISLAWGQTITEGFEGASFPPTGWANGGTTLYTYSGTGINYAHGGTHSARFPVQGNNIYTFQLANPATIHWYARQEGNGNCVSHLRTSSNGTTWSANLDSNHNMTNNIWNEYSYTITGSNLYVMFIFTQGGNTTCYLDDVTMTPSVTNYYWRTLTSGNWNSPSTWQYSGDNITWYNAFSQVPDNTSLGTTIRNTHAVTVTANTSTVRTTVESTGSVIVNNGVTLTVANTAATTDMLVNGSISTIGTGLVNGAGEFTLSSSANLATGHASGISTTAATGCIQVTGTKTFSTAANYTFNGTSAQVTGNALTQTNNLTINNSAGVALTGSCVVNGALTLTTALGIGANTLTINGTTSGSGGLVGGSTSSIIVGGTGNIALPSVSSLYDLNITRVATIGLSSTVTINHNFNLATGTIVNATNANTLAFASGATGTGTGTVNGPVRQNSTTIAASGTFSNVYMWLSVVAGTGGVNPFAALKTDVANTINGSSSISKTWNLSGTSTTSNNVTLRWPTTADNGNSFANGYGTVWRYNGSTWVQVYTGAVTTTSGVRSVSFGYNFGAGGSAGDFTVKATNPTITTSVPSLTNFGLVKVGTTSAFQSYTASGVELIANLALTAPTGYEISLASGSGYGPSLTLTQTNGFVNATTIYVHFIPSTLGPISGNVTHISSPATQVNVGVSGTGITNPVITSPTSTSVTATGAVLGGNITNINYGNVTTRGIYWSTTNGFADGAGTPVSETGTYGTGIFTLPVSGLTTNTVYFYKAFATNAAGTAYTSQGTFTTIGIPVIGSPTTASVTATSAVLGGNITNINLSDVTTRGIYWSTTNGFADGTGTQVAQTGTYSTGIFTIPVSGLTANTTYYFKAFATNAAGTAYTTQSTFTTLYVSHPADYYRTIATGTWNTISLWESSEDNVHWYPATQAPDYLALGINIRNQHIITMTTGVLVDDLLIDNGGRLIIPAGVTMTINNGTAVTDFVHNGNLTVTGVVSFNSGATANCGTTSYVLYDGTTPQTISGFTQFGSLDITNISGVSLGNSIIIDITFNLAIGATLDATDVITLSFSPGATANGGSNVNGTVIQHTVAIPRTTTYFNIDVGIVVVAGAADVDPFQAIKMDKSSMTSISRTWNITGLSATSGTITLRWPTTKDNGNTFDNGMCRVWKYSGGSWNVYSTEVVSLIGNTRSATFSYAFDIRAENDFTITESDATLPVELSSFTALLTPQNFVRLDWTTQSETNVLGYYIYRNIIDNVNSAELVSPMIAATNTSQEVSYSYVDREIPGDGTYYYWLQNQDINGSYEFHGPLSTLVQMGNNDTPVIPMVTTLDKPYPNPFNPSVTISYKLSKAEHVLIQIYNNKGQLVRTMLDADKNPGITRMVWDGKTDSGKNLPTGIYFIKMDAGRYSNTQKIVMMK